VVYASETGTSRKFSQNLRELLSNGMDVKVRSIANIDLAYLKKGIGNFTALSLTLPF